MLKKVAFSPLMLSLLILVFAASAFSQTTAKILGTVSDQSGAAVVGATVTIKNTALQLNAPPRLIPLGPMKFRRCPLELIAFKSRWQALKHSWPRMLCLR